MNDRRSDEAAALLGSSATLTSTQDQDTRSHSIWPAIIATTSVVILLDIGRYLSLAPQTAILESIVCNQYYAQNQPNTILEPRFNKCKIEPVQSEVAIINGWKDVFGTLPAILVAVPYGALADRIGRKKVQLLAIIGICLSDGWDRLIYWFSDTLPLRLLWLSGGWQLIGAGGATLSAIAFAQVADICPVEQRTTAFSFIAAAELLNQLLFLPIGAGLMSIDPWIPLFATIALNLLGLVSGALLVQETLPNPEHPDGRERRVESTTIKDSFRDLLHNLATGASKFGRWASGNIRVIMVMISTFCFTLATQCDNTLLLQYASKRLGWTIGEASFLLSFRAGVTLFVMAVALPVTSSFLVDRLQLHETVKDMRVTQACGGCFALGAVMIFLATRWVPLVAGQIIFSLGFIYKVSARSLVTQMVAQRQRGTALTAIAILIQAGGLAGASFLAAAFRLGMKLGDFWTGMPFLIAGGFSLVGLLSISAVDATVHRGEINRL
ncbi:major facilitator superfamily domain-containing protein [Apiosordaria backusii]|uniref:Major facilitator superfamily domain-containing protein n=1 Tax=Apiosordaria backusii TaxID=314023 RepID=A0AA40A6V6_9PEZI|nr:major facilitator superfamily domain-containing protein [Apiosordaria backusii]